MRQQSQHRRSTGPREKNAVYASIRSYWDRISARIREALDTPEVHNYRVVDRVRNFPSGDTSQNLPDGFQKRKTTQGQVYFLHSSGHKTWYDPRIPKELLSSSLNIDSLVGKLSSSWEIRVTPNGKCYFVNHLKKTTQFTDPRLVANREFLMTVLNKRVNNHVITPNTMTNVCQNQNPRLRTENRSYHGETLGDFVSSSSHPTTLSNNKGNSTLMSQSSTTKSKRKIEAPPHYHASHAVDPPVYSLSLNNNTKSANSNSNTLSISPPNTRSSNSYNKPQDSNYHNAIQTPSKTVSENFVKKPDEPHSSGITKKNRELFDKIAILRQELQSLQVPSGPCRIEVSRKNVFEQSYRAIMKLRPKDLRKRLMVKFRGEEGLDYGGVAREWLYLLSREMLNPNYGLFQYTRDDIYNLQINPDSGIAHQEHLCYLNFCGRVMGLAVFHGHHIEGCFTLPFYKMLLKKQIILEDIEHVDPELHRSLCWMLSNDISDVIDTTFSVEHNAYGEIQVNELKEGGKDIPVTQSNKHEYVSLYVNYRYRMGIEQQFKSLQKGFYELIPPHLVAPFDERELELLIGGLSKIDIEDWRKNTKLKHCTVDTPLVKWFWEVVESYGEDKRARLLQFVTGSSRVPLQGFKALQGVNAGPRLFTIHLVHSSCRENLPKAHTCFNRIDIPPYESFGKIYDKLTQAIEETIGFAVE